MMGLAVAWLTRGRRMMATISVLRFDGSPYFANAGYFVWLVQGHRGGGAGRSGCASR